MKIIKTASGKMTVKMNKTEWEEMGKKAGWVKEASMKNIGQVGIVSLQVATDREARGVTGSLPIGLTISLKGIGDYEIADPQNAGADFDDIFNELYRVYKTQIDAASKARPQMAATPFPQQGQPAQPQQPQP